MIDLAQLDQAVFDAIMLGEYSETRVARARLDKHRKRAAYLREHPEMAALFMPSEIRTAATEHMVGCKQCRDANEQRDSERLCEVGRHFYEAVNR